MSQAPSLPAQPFLLEVPEEELAAVEYEHTGASVLKHPDHATLVASYALAHSIRAAAKTFNIGRNTVTAALTALNRAGKLEPIKEKLAAGMEITALLLHESLQEDILNQNLKPEYKSIALMQVIDKVAQLRGELPVGTGAGQDATKQLDEFEARFRKARPAAVIDVVSTGTKPNPSQTTLPGQLVTASGDGATGPDLVDEAAKGGGGGCPSSAPGGIEGLPSQNFDSKGESHA